MPNHMLDNPTVIALLGGLGFLVLQQMYYKFTGANDEKSIPAQLRDIDTKLADINSKLQLAQERHDNTKEALKDLRNEFRQHMTDYHSAE